MVVRYWSPAQRSPVLKTNPVWISGARESVGHSNMLEMDDFTATSAHRSAETGYTMTGLGPADMEMAQIYDSFTITAAITAEMLGLAPRGEGHTLWKDGHAAPAGNFRSIPMMGACRSTTAACMGCPC